MPLGVGEFQYQVVRREGEEKQGIPVTSMDEKNG
jgi:hypothetical protein